jgi:hypothetical protein
MERTTGRTGRPPKAPQDRRSVRVAVWLTPGEAERLDALRGAENRTRSQWLAKPLREMSLTYTAPVCICMDLVGSIVPDPYCRHCFGSGVPGGEE